MLFLLFFLPKKLTFIHFRSIYHICGMPYNQFVRLYGIRICPNFATMKDKKSAKDSLHNLHKVKTHI